jgi:hypothetical protein
LFHYQVSAAKRLKKSLLAHGVVMRVSQNPCLAFRISSLKTVSKRTPLFQIQQEKAAYWCTPFERPRGRKREKEDKFYLDELPELSREASLEDETEAKKRKDMTD